MSNETLSLRISYSILNNFIISYEKAAFNSFKS